MLHQRAARLAARLLAGQVLELEDEHGRRWRATSTALSWVVADEAAPVLEGCAGDVAIAIASRRLRYAGRRCRRPSPSTA